MRASEGDTRSATVSLRRSLERFDDLSLVFKAARTREALAALVPDDQVGTLLQQALEAYERLDAQPHATRVRARLAARH